LTWQKGTKPGIVFGIFQLRFEYSGFIHPLGVVWTKKKHTLSGVRKYFRKNDLQIQIADALLSIPAGCRTGADKLSAAMT